MLFQKGVFNFHYFKYFKIHLNFLKFNVFVSYSEIAPEVLFYPKQQCVMILNSYYNGFLLISLDNACSSFYTPVCVCF